MIGFQEIISYHVSALIVYDLTNTQRFYNYEEHCAHWFRNFYYFSDLPLFFY